MAISPADQIQDAGETQYNSTIALSKVVSTPSLYLAPASRLKCRDVGLGLGLIRRKEGAEGGAALNWKSDGRTLNRSQRIQHDSVSHLQRSDPTSSMYIRHVSSFPMRRCLPVTSISRVYRSPSVSNYLISTCRPNTTSASLGPTQHPRVSPRMKALPELRQRTNATAP